MLKIQNLTCKNFMSVGQATQTVKFDTDELTLVLGENLDMGGDDSGSRNGVGKTSVLNALCYALYGQAISNIKRDNLINLTNTKNMLVTIDFELNGKSYRIERGRKPAVLKFYINDIEQKVDEDEAQGDSRETQNEINKLLGMSVDMFKHIVALNTYTEPFLSLKTNDQREIIEQLLGITLLSEKADKLKELIKSTKDMISEEEHRITAVNNANKKIEDQISSIEMKQRAWIKGHAKNIESLSIALSEMNELNIEGEISNHKILQKGMQDEKDLKRFRNEYKNSELLAEDASTRIDTIKQQIETVSNNVCHACGQKVHNEHVNEQKDNLEQMLKDIEINYHRNVDIMLSLKQKIDAIDVIKPNTFYKTIDEAFNHKSQVETLVKQLESKLAEKDPYEDTIIEMKSIGLEGISYDYLNQLVSLRDHQEFLLKLLTNKDSFIRKKIIDQNLNYLNSRLGYYLEKIGLPHTVLFQNDLTVMITELGRELDFDNLSRGERNRLILSLSFAFRDVWEGLYHPINLLFIDECLDNGTDPAGVEGGLSILKHMTRERNKSVWLVSHRDELITRVSNIMKVIKENGFSRFESSTD
jgi:DNA repair exonuclease SbcCD ATPase subunit